MTYIITNNKMVVENFNYDNYVFIDGDIIDVLKYVRDKVQLNYLLLTHPLASNLLPDKTIYKTIIIKEGSELDLQSLQIIEDAIILAEESLPRRSDKILSDNILTDLRYIDYQIIIYSLYKIQGG
ncbi:GrdX family protein [Mycoplasmatota bacterium]|nr:GrdX family protein [Mycoplasmatota bacterium]